MNSLTIIGNLTRDPQLRTVNTANGQTSVCSFAVAVNDHRSRNNQNTEPHVDYFNVTAWRGLGESCSKYLAKGRKVCVRGSVSVRTYQAQDGTTRAVMEVTAEEVEFLSGRNDADNASGSTAPVPTSQAPTAQSGSGFEAVDTDELPF